MGQQKALIYAFVGRGNVILAEYTDFSGNFNSIAYQCLQKLPASNNKFTYNCDGHTFNYLVDNGFRFKCQWIQKKLGDFFHQPWWAELLTIYAGGRLQALSGIVDVRASWPRRHC